MNVYQRLGYLPTGKIKRSPDAQGTLKLIPCSIEMLHDYSPGDLRTSRLLHVILYYYSNGAETDVEMLSSYDVIFESPSVLVII